MPKVQLFNTQTEQSDIKKRTYVSKETQVRFNQNSLAFKTKLRCTENSCQFENLFLTKLTG